MARKIVVVGGRITLLNSVISNLPSYYMSFYEMPPWVIKRIDKIRRDFLWKGGHERGKGLPLVKWERVCKKREFGGLGIVNLKEMNMALLGKWWWRSYSDCKGVWHMTIFRSKFRRRGRGGLSVFEGIFMVWTWDCSGGGCFPYGSEV